MALTKYISENTLQALKAFAGLGRTAQGLHPLDLDRWHVFVWAAFGEGKEIPAFELKDWLVANGWYEERASEFAVRFQVCMELLAYNRKRGRRSDEEAR